MAAAPVAAPFEILHEDNHLLVVVKPSGLLSQGDRTGDPTILDLAAEYLRTRYHKPANVYLGLVHRLDRPVSGVLVLARTSKAARRVSQQIRAHQVDKRYRVVVEGQVAPPQGRLVHHLLKRGEVRRVRVLDHPQEGSRRAELEYEVLAEADTATALSVRLVTGRSHQIRAQLAAVGHPILGDRRYGSVLPPSVHGSFALHAESFSLDHPTTGERLTFTAPPPPQWPWPPPAELRSSPRCRPSTVRARVESAPRPLAPPTVTPPAPSRSGGLGHGVVVLQVTEHIVAAHKPAGLPVQATRDPRRPHLIAALDALLPAPPTGRPLALLTRLPVLASGAVLLARTRSGARSLEAQLKRRRLRRLFALIVRGSPPDWPRLPDAGAWQLLSKVGLAAAWGPALGGAFLLLVEPRRAPLRALDELLEQRGWQVAPAHPAGGADPSAPPGELRHLLRVRSDIDAGPAPGGVSPLDILAPLPEGFAPWAPSSEILTFAPDDGPGGR